MVVWGIAIPRASIRSGDMRVRSARNAAMSGISTCRRPGANEVCAGMVRMKPPMLQKLSTGGGFLWRKSFPG